jgi:DNA mismatch repair protein MutS2
LALSGAEGRREPALAEVQAGPLRMRVPLSDIVALVTTEPPHRVGTTRPAAQTNRMSARIAAAEAPSDEINVIGCTVEEAIRRVDKFLDDAALAAKPRVRLIHGHGTGALRRGLREFLAGHPHVQRFADEEPERGGSAVTVVELRS